MSDNTNKLVDAIDAYILEKLKHLEVVYARNKDLPLAKINLIAALNAFESKPQSPKVEVIK